jgi:hypothetical protein
VPDPLHVAQWGTDLEARLLFTLANAYASRTLRTQEVLDFLRAEALRPGKARPVLATLASCDPLWLEDNLATILMNTPGIDRR